MDFLLSGPVVVECEDKVATLTLNRPARCNAINVEMSRALIEACSNLSLREDVSVVVVRGRGRHFCSGSDLNDLYQVDREEAEKVVRLEIDACCAIANLPQLTVAVMQGKCLGGGAILPLYCDIRIGRAGVEFAMPEVSLGWLPPYGLARLSTVVSRSAGIEMLLSGRVCTDKEALAIGWLQLLLESEEDERAYIHRLGKMPRHVLRDTVEILCRTDIATIRAADEKALMVFLRHFESEYAKGTVTAFMQRKKI